MRASKVLSVQTVEIFDRVRVCEPVLSVVVFLSSGALFAVAYSVQKTVCSKMTDAGAEVDKYSFFVL